MLESLAAVVELNRILWKSKHMWLLRKLYFDSAFIAAGMPNEPRNSLFFTYE